MTYHVHRDSLIGHGMEAEVYAYDLDKVLKIYSGTTSISKQRMLKQFYDALDAAQVPFQLPGIQDVREEGDIVITIEHRIHGRSMSEILSQQSEEQMNRIMKEYVSTVLALKKIAKHPPFEGFKLFHLDLDPEATARDWFHFMQQFLQLRLQEVGGQLSSDV
ncbi:hypothetical protein V7139_28755, partial [Neobacillus drentensis]|uniref:hypothetical protein n=1 Tax=Neobacillus drentensis TaxID=220684 RepID=UPI003001786F